MYIGIVAKGCPTACTTSCAHRSLIHIYKASCRRLRHVKVGEVTVFMLKGIYGYRYI